MVHHEWLLKRNCSLTPRQLGTVYAGLCSVSLGLGIVCTLRGAWHVLPFALFEMAWLALAFLHYARHALDREHIVLDDECLLVQQVVASQTRELQLDPRCVRIYLGQHQHSLIRLQAGAQHIDIGYHVLAQDRARLAADLQQKLRSWSGAHTTIIANDHTNWLGTGPVTESSNYRGTPRC